MSKRHSIRSVLIVTALACGVQAAEPAERENIFGIRLPQSIDDAASVAYEDPQAGFRFMQWYSSYFFQGMRRYEQAGLGYSLGYATPSSDISIYVYDYGLDAIPDGTDSQVMRDELASSTNGIAQSGQYARVDQQAVAEPLSPHFAQTTQILTTNAGERIQSYVLLRGQKGYFVKVRMTGPSAGMEPAVADFLKYVARDIGIENSGAPPAFDSQ